MKKIIKRYFIFLALINSAICATNSPKKKLLIFDTSGTTSANYTQLTAIAQSVGFEATFTNFYDPPTSLNSFDTVILLLEPTFFQKALTKKKHPLVDRVITLVKKYVKNENGLLALLFPGRLTFSAQNQNAFCSLLNTLEIHPATCTTIQDLAPCIFSTDEQRSSSYRTALYPAGLPNNQIKKTRCRLSKLKKLEIEPMTLPVGNQKEPFAQLTPFGIYSKPFKSAGIFLGPASHFTATEIEENMFFTPYNWKQRKQVLSMLQQTIWQLHELVTHQKVPTQSNNNLSLPDSITPIFALEKKQQLKKSFEHTLLERLNNQKINCAWMEVEPLKDHLKEAVSAIKTSQLNLLWFSFNPEWYLSPKAVRSQKQYAQTQEAIEGFTQKLKKEFTPKNMPTIFAGFDLTNNFSKTPINKPVADVYGKTYSKIPSPFDTKTLWENEFIKPLKTFVEQWKTKLSNGIPLSGIFFDLEMYHAPKQAAVYNNLMDFSDFAWNLYAQQSKQPSLANKKTVNARVTFLMKNKLFKSYFSLLEKEAQKLGRQLKQEIKKQLPQALIGVYLPSLLDCWFYRGLLAGLSSEQEPVILATFNTNYYGHTNWLQKHSIHALHLPVVMLSHIETPHADTEFSKLHDGVWINRFSRLFQPCQKKEWYFLECSRQKRSLVTEHIKAYTRK